MRDICSSHGEEVRQNVVKEGLGKRERLCKGVKGWGERRRDGEEERGRVRDSAMTKWGRE